VPTSLKYRDGPNVRYSGWFIPQRRAAAPACRELGSRLAILSVGPAIVPVLSVVQRAAALGPWVRLGRGAFSALSFGDGRPVA
jgi:hypothetical protein